MSDDVEGRAQFSVVLFYADDTHQYVRRWIDARTAVETAKAYTQGPAALAGIVRRIIITDGGDDTCFAWEWGKGVTYPPDAVTGQPR